MDSDAELDVAALFRLPSGMLELFYHIRHYLSKEYTLGLAVGRVL